MCMYTWRDIWVVNTIQTPGHPHYRTSPTPTPKEDNQFLPRLFTRWGLPDLSSPLRYIHATYILFKKKKKPSTPHDFHMNMCPSGWKDCKKKVWELLCKSTDSLLLRLQISNTYECPCENLSTDFWAMCSRYVQLLLAVGAPHSAWPDTWNTAEERLMENLAYPELFSE